MSYVLTVCRYNLTRVGYTHVHVREKHFIRVGAIGDSTACASGDSHYSLNSISLKQPRFVTSETVWRTVVPKEYGRT